jgi:hypothetical protein
MILTLRRQCPVAGDTVASDRACFTQTAGLTFGSETVSFPEFPAALGPRGLGPVPIGTHPTVYRNEVGYDAFASSSGPANCFLDAARPRRGAVHFQVQPPAGDGTGREWLCFLPSRWARVLPRELPRPGAVACECRCPCGFAPRCARSGGSLPSPRGPRIPGAVFFPNLFGARNPATASGVGAPRKKYCGVSSLSLPRSA